MEFNNPLIISLLVTVLVLGGLYFVRWGVSIWVRRDNTLLTDTQRKRLFYIRSATHILGLLCIILIWMPQLQHMALSLTAVLVAVVIATKELLICLAGFMLRTEGRSFGLGDWIEVNGVRGEVVGFTPLSTTLLELDDPANGRQYTGRTTTIPNAWFVTHNVVNETFGKNYAVHQFHITVESAVDISAAQQFLIDDAVDRCAKYQDVATRYNAMIERKLGVDVPGPEPEVAITTTDLGRVQFHVLLFCPTQVVKTIETEITKRFLDAINYGDIPRPASEKSEKTA